MLILYRQPKIDVKWRGAYNRSTMRGDALRALIVLNFTGRKIIS
jgi:hypothetical protein